MKASSISSVCSLEKSASQAAGPCLPHLDPVLSSTSFWLPVCICLSFSPSDGSPCSPISSSFLLNCGRMGLQELLLPGQQSCYDMLSLICPLSPWFSPEIGICTRCRLFSLCASLRALSVSADYQRLAITSFSFCEQQVAWDSPLLVLYVITSPLQVQLQQRKPLSWSL